MNYVYFYHAIHQPDPASGASVYIDGLCTRSKPIRSWEDYMAFKTACAAEGGVDPKRLTLCSLTLLDTFEDVAS